MLYVHVYTVVFLYPVRLCTAISILNHIPFVFFPMFKKKKRIKQKKKKQKKNNKSKQTYKSFKLEDSHIYTFMMEAIYS
jgi:hypothetical protein